MLQYSFALFYFEFEDNFRVQAPGGLYLEGRFIGVFFFFFAYVCVKSLGGGGGYVIWGIIIQSQRHRMV